MRVAPASLVAIVLLAGCAAGPTSSGDPARRVTQLADEYVAAYSKTFPETAFVYGLPLDRDDGLSDNSLAARRQWEQREDAWLAEVRRIDGEALWGRPEWVTYGFLREALEAAIGLRACRNELWPLNQIGGWQAAFAGLAAQQPVGTGRRRADALARWRQLPRYLDTEIENLRAGLRLGYTTPRRNVELTIAQLDALLTQPPEQSPFFSPAQRDGDPDFRKAWTRLMWDELLPAMRRYRDFARNEYLPKAREGLAITFQPRGAECWRASYRASTSLDRSPEEVHALGREMVARNQLSLRTRGRATFGTGDPDELLKRIADDAANHYRHADEIQEQARKVLAHAEAVLPQWFGRLPKARMAITPIPDALAASSSAHYYPAAEDGSRPATYFIRLHEPERQLRSRNEITAFHEGYPGHHLQIALAQELRGSHPIGRLVGVGAYIEGWARYAEALSEEMGLYESRYAAIARRFWPARGMVVDTGLHTLGWTRAQAIAYIVEGGLNIEAEPLVDRIVVWPAQLTAYDSGAREFFALRAQAQEALGERFDIRAFHDEVLGYGAVTLPMLRRIVERWIAERHSRESGNPE